MTDREQFEKWCDLTERDLTDHDLFAAWQASRSAALEQAAKVCDERALNFRDNLRSLTCEACANAIRALSGPTET